MGARDGVGGGRRREEMKRVEGKKRQRKHEEM